MINNNDPLPPRLPLSAFPFLPSPPLTSFPASYSSHLFIFPPPLPAFSSPCVPLTPPSPLTSALFTFPSPRLPLSQSPAIFYPLCVPLRLYLPMIFAHGFLQVHETFWECVAPPRASEVMRASSRKQDHHGVMFINMSQYWLRGAPKGKRKRRK